VNNVPSLADQVPERSLSARVRNTRGKLLVAQGPNSVELDEVGIFVFKSIDGKATLRDIATRISAEYDVGYEQALADTAEFIAELAGMEIVVMSSAAQDDIRGLRQG